MGARCGPGSFDSVAIATDLKALEKMVAAMHINEDAGVHPVALSQ
jgi:hypothetical protein